jgi:hypothetical protein
VLYSLVYNQSIKSLYHTNLSLLPLHDLTSTAIPEQVIPEEPFPEQAIPNQAIPVQPILKKSLKF